MIAINSRYRRHHLDEMSVQNSSAFCLKMSSLFIFLVAFCVINEIPLKRLSYGNGSVLI